MEMVLRILQGGAETAVNILDAMTMPKSEFWRTRSKRMAGGGFHFDEDWAERYRDGKRFAALLNYLKQEGLVEQKAGKWSVTDRGRSRLNETSDRNRWGAASSRYAESGTDTTFKIITYDIPGTRDGQKQRQWLRSALKNLGFRLLQRSVWVGKRKIPERFMTDLRERKLLPAVQVFAVSKAGTLRELE